MTPEEVSRLSWGEYQAFVKFQNEATHAQKELGRG